MSKSIADVNKEQYKKFGTENNTDSMFKEGDRVRIVCVCSDFHFFNGTEKGTVVEVEYGVQVKFDRDDARHLGIETFGFRAVDLMKLGPMTRDDYIRVSSDSIEEHFPKGKCKERGAAMVLIADILNHLMDTGTITE